MNALEPRADQPPAVTPGTPAQHGLDDLYDIGRLAERLGVEHATIRVWLSRKVPWLPSPDGRLNGGAVWRATTLENIETRRTPGRPGRKPRSAQEAPTAVATDGSPGAHQAPHDGKPSPTPPPAESRPAPARRTRASVATDGRRS